MAFSYCTFEMNYDNFHKDAEHIFRIGTPEGDNGSRAPLISELKQEMPEIKEVTCFSRRQVYTYQTPKHTFYVNTIFADTSFFRIFSFQVLSGNPHTDLNDPHKISFLKNGPVSCLERPNQGGRKFYAKENYLQ